MSPRTTHSTCYMCTDNCPITVVSEGDEVISIDHPECVRASAMLEQRTSPRRWTRPRLRSRSTDAWREVSWDEALSSSVRRLEEVRDRHGPASVAFVAGFTKEVRPYLKRLAHSFGSPHYLTESSCCFGAGSIAAAVTLGEEYGYYLGPSRERYPETRCRLVWSKNPAESRLPYEKHHLMTEAARVPTIVVDPRRTPLAEVARLHLRLRPGTDGALAHGLAHVILEENLEDGDFLKEFAHGLDRYREYVRRFTPQETATITGIDPETIVAAARLYATTRPGQITISSCSTTHHSNGFQNHRAVLLLSALCGNLDVAGGNRPWGHRLTEASVELSPQEVDRLGPPLGSDRFPLFVERYGEGQAMVLADAIES
ncbi:molybdopterin-dependent oxidoreductase, partial [Gemmatimonadota bacterium]